MQNKGTVPKNTLYRKTSAEIIKEAQSSLATSNGAKLVSTRRPITPNVNNRQLYGSTSFANGNRPPSAFNLKYLQHEMRALPSLEPINQSISNNHENRKVQRSNSIGEVGKARLPALIEPPTFEITASGNSTGSLESLREVMPLQKGKSISLPTPRQTDEQLIKRKKPMDDNETIKRDESKNRLIRSNDILLQSSLDTLLDMLKAYAGIKECSEETQTHLHMILSEIHSRIKGTKSNRGIILGALYGLVECNSPKILLNVARVVLALNVSGSNLTGACKLVFKVARNEVNDSLFIDSDVPELLVDALGRVNPTAEGEPEAAIYGYGAIRFLATANLNSLSKKTENVDSKSIKTIKVSKQKSLAYRLVKHGIIQLMIVHLQILNEFGSNSKLSGHPLHALYQLSGALRVISGSPIFAQIINLRHSRASSIDEEDTHLEMAGKHLVRAAEICMDEIEVQTNIVRTLSILSEIDTCCEYMAGDAGRLGILLISYNCTATCSPEKALSVISRLGYILGNIHAKYDESRIEFFNNDAAMECLLNTFEHFSNQRFDMKNSNGDSVMDVLIKLIRVIANMSVNSEVGHGLGLRHPLGAVLLNVLLQSKEIKTEEALELTLAALAALHNLSYYHNTFDDGNSNHPGSMSERAKDISLALSQILSNGPQVAKSEAARVLGNLTRNPGVRQSFCTSNGLKILVKCLQKNEDIELMTSSCGVLVNLLGDWERRASFKELNGIKVLRETLTKSAMSEDWLLCGMCCQAFWNFLIDSNNVIETLGEKESDLLAGDLAEYLDEEKIFKDSVDVDPMWEQFAHVATDLLERLQSCMSHTNSPINSSDDERELAIGKPINDSWSGYTGENI